VIDDTQVQGRMPSTPVPGSPAARGAGLTGGGADARSVALVAVFTAMLVAAAVVPGVPLGGLGVPITMQTLAVLLTGLVLGPARGAIAVVLYLALGFAGLPIFSRGQSGLQVLAGPTAGYLVSFALAATVVGAAAALVVGRTRRTLWAPLLAAAAVLASVAVIHTLGVAGLMVNAKLSLGAAVAADLPFLPGDVVKAVVAGIAAAAVHRAFPDVLVRPLRRPS